MNGLLEDLWDPQGPRRAGTRVLVPLLRAAEGCFRAAVALRETAYRRGWRRAEVSPLPVVSVGGVEVGGVGKTPATLELLRIAAEAGLRPAVLSRGYGSDREDVRRVPVSGAADAKHFGDEPVWMAEESAGWDTFGVWVALDRRAAAVAARAAGAGLLILDDGLQHRRLARDGEVVCLSGRAPLGNGRLLPAGPLRETPRQALARADRIVLSGAGADEAAEAARTIRPYVRSSVPIFSWRSEPSLRPMIGVPPEPGEPIALLAGIAHPERLHRALALLGHPIERARLLGDHHRFSERDLRPLRAGRIAWVVTEKDWIRLRPLLAEGGAADGGAPEGMRVALLSQKLEWNDPGAERSWAVWLRGLATGRATSPRPRSWS